MLGFRTLLTKFYRNDKLSGASLRTCRLILGGFLLDDTY